MSSKFRKAWQSSLREGWPIYFLALITLVAGLSCGGWGAQTLDQQQSGQLTEYLDTFVTKAESISVDRPEMVKNTITNNLFFIGLIYVLGLTVIGTPVILALLFVRGVSLGFTLGFLTKQKAAEGVVIALASVVPQNILLLPAVFMASVSALSFSWLLIKRLRNSQLPVLPGLMGYHLLMLIVCCISAAAGLVEAYITPQLIKTTANFLISFK